MRVQADGVRETSHSYTDADGWDPVRREPVGVGSADEVRDAARASGTTFVVVAHDENGKRWAYMVVDEIANRYEVSYTCEEPIFPAESSGAVRARALFVPGGQGRVFESTLSVSPRDPGDPDSVAHPFQETFEQYPDGTMVHVEEYEPGIVARTEFPGLDPTDWYLPNPEAGEWGPLFMKNAGG